MHISQLVSTDSRNEVEKLRRTHCKNILKAYGVEYNPASPKTKLVSLIEGHGIDVTRPLPDGDSIFQMVAVKDEKGNVSTEVYPKEKDHATKNKSIDYNSVIEAKNKATEKEDENTALKKEIESLKALMNKDMKMSELRSIAKEKGINSFGMKKSDLMKAVNGNPA